MSNYFEYVHIRNSLLTGNKSLKLYKGLNQKQIDLFNYTVQPQSNENVIVNGYNIIDNNNKGKITLIVKIQLYILTQQGDPVERYPIIGAIGLRNADTQVIDYDIYSNSVYSRIDKFIQDFINKMPTLQIDVNGQNYHYDIDKIYAVPTDWVYNNGIAGAFLTYDLFDDGSGNMFVISELRGNSSTGIEQTYTKTIQFDRTIDSIGLFTLPVKIVNNGTNITVTVSVYLKFYGIAIILNIQNKMLDITENFLVDLPFTQATSSELQLQRIQRINQGLAEREKIDKANIAIDYNKIGFVIDAGSMETSSLETSAGGSTPTGGLFNGMSNLFGRAEKREIQDVNVRYAENRLNLINKKMYSSSVVANNNFSYINGLYGLCVFKINEDNTRQIEQGVKLSGYIVRELVNDVIQELDIENLTDHYEVFKFDEVNIYGVIAQDYLRVIERVLLNGVRVWCQGNIGELI